MAGVLNLLIADTKARILEWDAIPFSSGSSRSRDQSRLQADSLLRHQGSPQKNNRYSKRSGMVALRIPRGLWTAAVMVTLAVLSTPGAEGRDSPQDFLFQFKGLCYFTNGTERVRSVNRYIYNREEYVRFDSDVNEYRAVTPLGRPDAEYWNSQEGELERVRAEEDTVCRNNYEVELITSLQRQVEPTVTISPSRTETLNHHNLLVCSVTDFYPGSQSESAQSKMLSGVGGFVLGLIFLGLGLIVRHRSQKGLAR